MRTLIITLICVTVLISGACQNSNHVEIRINIPIDSPITVSMHNTITGAEVFRDTVKGGTTVHRIDSIAPGGYRIVCSWDRTIIQLGEMRHIERYQLEGHPQYYLTKEIWVTKNRPARFEFTIDGNVHTQASVEESLLYDDQSLPLNLTTNDKQSKKFDEFVRIEETYRERNRVKKDSLKSVLYDLLDAGDMEEHAKMSKTLGKPWLDDVINEMMSTEVKFLRENIDHPMIPYLLVTRISSPEDFQRYKEVFDALPPTIQEKTKPHLSRFMQ